MPAYQKLHRVQQQQDPSLGDNQALPLTFVDTPIPVVVPNQTLNMSAMDLFDSIFWGMFSASSLAEPNNFQILVR